MNNIAKFIILIFLIINFSLAARQPSVMHIVLKTAHLPRTIEVKTKIAIKLDQWITLSHLTSLNQHRADNSTIPFGVVRNIPCHDRSLIFWRMFRSKKAVLMNEILLFNNCKVLSDIKWRQTDKLNRPVHIKTQYIDAITTLTAGNTGLKPLGRFGL